MRRRSQTDSRPARTDGTTSERAAADRSWTYGHIVVDEAQELSPMQWRVLFRRNPLKSFTVVGDVAQASAAAGSTSWQDALRPFVKDDFRLEELTVNYRTPAQIVAVAERMAEAHGVRITTSRAVREGDYPVEVVVDAGRHGSGRCCRPRGRGRRPRRHARGDRRRLGDRARSGARWMQSSAMTSGAVTWASRGRSRC